MSKSEANPSPKDPSPKAVKFQEGTKNGASTTKPPQRTQPQRRDHPAKIHMGKSTFCREFGFPLGLVAFFLLVSWAVRDVGTNVSDQAKPDKMTLMGQMVSEMAEKKYKKRGGKWAPHCRLYLAKSTIAGAGYSLFAGRDYNEGDKVVLPGSASEFLAAEEEENSALEIHQYAFLLKHHHGRSNVDGVAFREAGSSQNVELRATKDIRAGDELLLPFSSHPRSQIGPHSNLFRGVPGEEEFALAEEIMSDLINKFRFASGREPKGNQMEQTLSLMYKTVRRLNPMVAGFLPTKKRDMTFWLEGTKHGASFDELALLPRSVQGLEMNAKCLSYTMKHPQSTTNAVITTQKLSQGAIVVPVPFRILARTNPTCAAEECSQPTHPPACWQPSNVPFALCPLTLPEWLRVEEGKEPNVEYQWGLENSSNEKSHVLSADEVIQQYTTQLSLDLVALRDIEPGETLRVKAGIEELIPEQWKVVP